MPPAPFQRWLPSILIAMAMALASPVLVAQTQPAPIAADISQPNESALLPVVDPSSGRIEVMLLLEPMPGSPVERLLGIDRVIGRPRATTLTDWQRPVGPNLDISASLSLDNQSNLALLCDSGAVLPTLASLADHCLLARLDHDADPLIHRPRGGAAEARIGLSGQNGAIALTLTGARLYDSTDIRFDSALSGHFGLPGQTGPWADPWLTIGDSLAGNALIGNLGTGQFGMRHDIQRLGLTGVMRLGRNGWINLGGTLARAQLIPTHSLLPGPLALTMSELTLGGGYGPFSGAITSRVIELPGQTRLNDLDIGLTWRTPWSGRLSIGARNRSGSTAGVNAFGLPELDTQGEDEEATIPYVRYRQDL